MTISNMMSPILFLLLISCSPVQSQITTSWNCTIITSKTISIGATYTQQKCYSSRCPSGPKETKIIPAGPLIINVVVADLSPESNLTLVPITALPNSVTPLNNMTNPTPNETDLLAGINAAYFFRVDEPHFFDGVCLGKLRKIALLPVSMDKPNHGVSDGAIIRNGETIGTNCDCLGENRITVLSINGTETRIDVLPSKGAPLPFGTTLDAIGAGPNLVTKSTIAIPPHDQNFANVYEHSANTGFGLRTTNALREAVFLTTDGNDGCKKTDPTCGTNAFTLAYLMRDQFKVDTAMGMDQGGSTTMWVQGAGVVSNPGAGDARPIFSGLFLAKKK